MYRVEIYEESEFKQKYPQVYSMLKSKIPKDFEFAQALSYSGDLKDLEIAYMHTLNDDTSLGCTVSSVNPLVLEVSIDTD
jgi:hypothetical protein